ncbi:MAG: Gldg family protein [Pirellulaceae bacterium]|nr:Gldg family protein [Pirellulaceae bacterium]
MLSALLWLLALDALFLGLLALALVPLCIYRPAASAVLKRNFVSYFNNILGYLFLCLFVLFCAVFAFWPHEFFTNNLANLDQLNQTIPFILVLFISAITMSIWAEERRQGTDELLLTLPAGDFDIVMGKYLAAVAIFTAALLFSQLFNFAVLAMLTEGNVDTGLIFSTYLGYWLAGLAMLSIGMVASFLTGNLTVGFILGLLFNVPLVFSSYADVIFNAPWLARWSMTQHLETFGRGVISLASTGYFLMIVVLGIYLSMVLIGRRHWSGGRDGHSMLGHFLVRIVALLVIVLGATAVLGNNDFIRPDASEGRVSSLSPETRRLMRDLEAEHPITIEAFISGQVPELYAQTKLDLENKLKEFAALPRGGKTNIEVRIYDNLETFSDEAALAEERYGIIPQPVRTRSRGAIKDEEILMGAAFTCGLEKVVVPFFDYGLPVEYELVRSITTVAQKSRRKLGVVRTDAQMFGGFSFAGGRPQQIPKQAILEELEKQYDVEEVDPTNPIDLGTFDVLLVVQPSSLGPAELNNVVDAIEAGQPTAIFEDPRPIFMANVPATGEPKQSPGGMFGMGGGQQPKGDMQRLWSVLGLEVPGERGLGGMYQPELAWQEYNPYLKLQIQGIPDSWVFASNDAPGDSPSINPDSPITSGLTEIFFPVPGTIRPSRDSELDFTALVTTGEVAGTLKFEDFMQSQGNPLMLRAQQGSPTGRQILAARIRGKAPAESGDEQAAADEKAADDKPADEKPAEGASETDGDAAKTRPIDVIYVTDIDLMISTFLRIRARPDEDEEIDWRFENVTFLLNIIDALAGDERYVPIRKRKPRHSTLTVVERQVQEARAQELEQRVKFQTEFDDSLKKAEEENQKAIEKFQKSVDELQEKQRKGEAIDPAELQAKLMALATQQDLLQRRLDIQRERLERERDREIKAIRRQVDLEILGIQMGIKGWVAFVAPLVPLLVGVVVFVRRGLREREGIARSRLR